MSPPFRWVAKLLAGVLAVLWPPYPFLRRGLRPGLLAVAVWAGAWLCTFLLWAGPGLLLLAAMSAVALATQVRQMRV